MSDVPNRNHWKFGFTDVEEYNIERLVEYYISNMYNRTLMAFKWNNLPDGMKSFDVEKFTQLRGFTLFIHDVKDGDRFYVLDGSKYDNITWNYEASKALIVNPALDGLKLKYKIGEDAVLIRNDYICKGLYPIFEKNAIDLADTDISIRYAQFNTRFKTLLTSDDDTTAATIKTLMAAIWKGEAPYAVVTNDLYKKSVEGVSYAGLQNTDIQNLIELKQYQLAQFYIDLGINANYNMKKESVSSDEFRMNDDALMPLIDNMLECRKMACEEINKIFGLNISVELNSSWLKKAKEAINSLEKEEAEIDKIEAEAEAADSKAEEDIATAEAEEGEANEDNQD